MTGKIKLRNYKMTLVDQRAVVLEEIMWNFDCVMKHARWMNWTKSYSKLPRPKRQDDNGLCVWLLYYVSLSLFSIWMDDGSAWGIYLFCHSVLRCIRDSFTRYPRAYSFLHSLQSFILFKWWAAMSRWAWRKFFSGEKWGRSDRMESWLFMKGKRWEFPRKICQVCTTKPWRWNEGSNYGMS